MAKQPPKRLKLKKAAPPTNPTQHFNQGVADYVEHFKGAASKQSKAKAYLNEIQGGMSDWSSSMDMTGKSAKKAAIAAKELAESHSDIARDINKFGKGLKDVKKQSGLVSDIFKDLFVDAKDKLMDGFSHSASVLHKVRRELQTIATQEIRSVEMSTQQINRRLSRAKIGLRGVTGGGGSSSGGAGGGGSGGGGGLGGLFSDPMAFIKGNPEMLAKLGMRAAGGLVLAGIGDSVAEGVKLSQELGNLFRANGTNYANFSGFVDKLPDLIVSTGLSRKEIIGLTESFQSMGIPVNNTNKSLSGYLGEIGKSMKMTDMDADTMSHFARVAYTADLSVAQLHDSLSKMNETSSMLGLSFSDSKQAIQTSIVSWKQLGGILGKSQSQMTAVSQNTTQLLVGLGSESDKAMPLLSGLGSEGWHRALSEDTMRRSGFGLNVGEDLFTGPGMKKYFESALFQLADTSFGGRRVGVEQNKNAADQQVYYQRTRQISDMMGMDPGTFQELASMMNESIRQHPELANASDAQIHQFVEQYVGASIGKMAAGRKDKSFDKSFTDHMRSLGQIPGNAMRLVEAGQTKMGAAAMTTVGAIENVGDIISGGFMDVLDMMGKIAPWAKTNKSSGSVAPPIPNMGFGGARTNSANLWSAPGLLSGSVSTAGLTSKGTAANQKSIMDYFVGKGLSPAQAAGITGNFMQEHGLQTSDAGAAGLGLGQWIGGRRKALVSYAGQTGRSPTDLGTQLDFAWKEMQSTELGAFKRLVQTKTAKEAADAVSEFYERPGNPMIYNRESYAQSFLNGYSPTLPANPAVQTPQIANKTAIPTLAQRQKQIEHDQLMDALQSPSSAWFPNLGMANGIMMKASPDTAMPLMSLGPTGKDRSMPVSTFDATAANSIIQGQLDASYAVKSAPDWEGRTDADDLFGQDAKNQTAAKQDETNTLLRQLLSHFQQKDQKEDRRHQDNQAQQQVQRTRVSDTTKSARFGGA